MMYNRCARDFDKIRAECMGVEREPDKIEASFH